jgi:hypothetical protein
VEQRDNRSHRVDRHALSPPSPHHSPGFRHQSSQEKLVAGRSRPSCETTRTGPNRLALLVDQQQRDDRIDRLDRHAVSPPSPCRHPGSGAGTGRESVERSS